MFLKDVLSQYHFTMPYQEALLATGIEKLHPPQIDTIKKGLLEDKSLVLAMPTASGKTLMAELAILKALMEKKGHCLYIAPLKALASEKYKDFNRKFASLNISTGIAIGDLDSPSYYLKNNHLIIATAEKVDSLLRAQSEWLVQNLAVVVFDEIHVLGDSSRGSTLEILATRIKLMSPQAQRLALSATVPNATQMAKWLNADIVESTWRPIPLYEGVFHENRLTFKDHSTKIIHENAPQDVQNLVLDTLKGKGQSLVFVNSRRSTQAVARELCSFVHPLLTTEEKKALSLLSKDMASSLDATPICQKLADAVKSGVAFHHAGLKPQQREAIEESFKNNLIKVICATPTLAAGVNLPARRAIIRDAKRYTAGMGQTWIPTSEYKQCAGRAGRPQYDSYGEAVLLAKTSRDQKDLFERFILAPAENIESQLSHPAELRKHILAGIASGYVDDLQSCLDFLSQTFLAHQNPYLNLTSTLESIFDFLLQEDFIIQTQHRLTATPFGARTSRLYIDPMSAVILKQGLTALDQKSSSSTIALLQLIVLCPDSEKLSAGKTNIESLEDFIAQVYEDLVFSPHDTKIFPDPSFFMGVLKTIWLLNRWMCEDKEDNLCEHFNIGPGDIFRHTDSAQWLLYAAESFAEIYHYKQLALALSELRLRMRYGIKEELLSLVSLKGVGRIRARILYNEGFSSVSDIQKADLTTLSQIKNIGLRLAQSLKQQVSK